MSETIKSETSCPTCGQSVKVGGDSVTHFYIPNEANRFKAQLAEAESLLKEAMKWVGAQTNLWEKYSAYKAGKPK